jgi:hypothetical protein
MARPPARACFPLIQQVNDDHVPVRISHVAGNGYEHL